VKDKLYICYVLYWSAVSLNKGPGEGGEGDG
jgi:hypothetical protein